MQKIILILVLLFSCILLNAEEMPDFEVKDINGQTYKSTDYKSAKIILFFDEAETISSPLLYSMKLLKANNPNIEFICLLSSLEFEPDITIINELTNTLSLNIPIYVDEERNLLNEIGYEKVPVTLVVDDQNNIVSKITSTNDYYGVLKINLELLRGEINNEEAILKSGILTNTITIPENIYDDVFEVDDPNKIIIDKTEESDGEINEQPFIDDTNNNDSTENFVDNTSNLDSQVNMESGTNNIDNESGTNMESGTNNIDNESDANMESGTNNIDNESGSGTNMEPGTDNINNESHTNESGVEVGNNEANDNSGIANIITDTNLTTTEYSPEDTIFMGTVNFCSRLLLVFVWFWGVLYCLAKVKLYKRMLIGALACLGFGVWTALYTLVNIPQEVLVLHGSFSQWQNYAHLAFSHVGQYTKLIHFALVTLVVTAISGRLKNEEI